MSTPQDPCESAWDQLATARERIAVLRDEVTRSHENVAHLKRHLVALRQEVGTKVAQRVSARVAEQEQQEEA